METNATFATRDNFNGASFDYENGGCKASGEFRFVETVLNSVTINGTYTKGVKSYNFWANRDVNGNLAINGVPSEVIEEVAAEVKAIVDKIEALNTSEG